MHVISVVTDPPCTLLQSFSSKDAYKATTTAIVSDIITLKASKSWLTEFGTELLIAVIAHVSVTVLQKTLLTPLLTELGEISKESSPDSLALAFALLRKLSGTDAAALPAQLRALTRHLVPGQLSLFVAPCVASCASFPRLHIVWSQLLQWFADHGHITPASSSTAPPKSAAQSLLFREFWSVVVEAELIPFTHEKRATALLLFASTVGRVDALTLKTMLTASLVQTWVTNLPKKTNLLHGLCVASVNALLQACANDSQRSVHAVTQLLANGSGNFDKRSGMSVVSTLIGSISEADLPDVVKQVHATLSEAKPAGGDDDDSDRESSAASVQGRLAWAIQALTGDGRNARCSAPHFYLTVML